jgi:hypothetical protein
MYPWSWFYAPQFHFPWSGSVAQHIEPTTEWFFGAIRPDAGSGDIERKAFEVASYGRQLGLLIEVLLAQSGQGAVTPEQAKLALERLTEIHQKIEAVKVEQAQVAVKSLTEQLELLRQHSPQEFQKLAKVFG